MTDSPYRGRFAPTPSGPLHFGSLIAALASYLDAKAQHGQWLVRIEDLDKPREVPGSADDILRTLEHFGLLWDETPLYQSQRSELYQAALNSLCAQDLAYPCSCSRKLIKQQAKIGPFGPIYPGNCRQRLQNPQAKQLAMRSVTDDNVLAFNDAIQGRFGFNLKQDSGDFVIQRADGFFAYQLAVVVDDALQNISHIVRGNDLLDSTPRQIHLQQQLGFPIPHYAHLPLALNRFGDKLSKQNLAQALPKNHLEILTKAALRFLNQPVPEETLSQQELLTWAITQWDLSKIPKQRQIDDVPEGMG